MICCSRRACEFAARDAVLSVFGDAQYGPGIFEMQA